MIQTKVSRTYAKSLLDLAIERGSLEDVRKDMQLVVSASKESKELDLLLQSPIVAADKKLNILSQVFKSSVSDLSMSFIELLASKGREAQLANVAYSFEYQYLEHKNILKTVIKSVDGVGADLKKKVEELVKATYKKDSLIEEVKDESLIGGFVITVGDQQVDASISKQLAKLQNQFSENPYVSEL